MASIRKQQKEATRQAFVQAALDLVGEGRSFNSISIRELAGKVGVVPTAYYRHFPDIETLGIDVIGLALPTLRKNLHFLRQGLISIDSMVEQSTDTYFDFVREYSKEMIFCGREIAGSCEPLRTALRAELITFSRDLADDLAKAPPLAELSDDDLMAMGDLMVRTLFFISQELVEIFDNEAAISVLRNRVVRQLKFVIAGAGAVHELATEA